MKGSRIVLGHHDGRAAAARLVDGRLDDLLIDPKDDAPLPGAIFRAVCDRPVKGQGGMFVKLGQGLTGFLRGAKGLAPGDRLLVQVTGHGEAGKAVPVTDRVLFKSRFCIVTPGAPGVNVARSVRDEAERARLREIGHDARGAGEAGLILRSASDGADAAAVAEDVAATWALMAQVMADDGRAAEALLDGPDAHLAAWRDWSADDVVEGWEAEGLPDLIDALRGPVVALGAANAVIEPTRAFVAVDVNTPEGGAGGLKANLALARELPRQLRLRGLGGQIVLDLAPMPKKERRGWESALCAALRTDPIETSFIGWTPLGHAELTRRRERRPLEELL
ncbi:MAG: ribonuclease E/G [Pseudomonadota bacterium]